MQPKNPKSTIKALKRQLETSYKVYKWNHDFILAWTKAHRLPPATTRYELVKLQRRLRAIRRLSDLLE